MADYPQRMTSMAEGHLRREVKKVGKMMTAVIDSMDYSGSWFSLATKLEWSFVLFAAVSPVIEEKSSEWRRRRRNLCC